MAQQSPAHYTRGAIEVWDFIRDQDLNYHLGNAIKYICRAGSKVLTPRLKTLKKLSTILKMNSYIHRSLMTMAEQFRSAYMLMTGVAERGVQKALIDENGQSFMRHTT